MSSSDAKLAAIEDYLKGYYDILNKSPFMLGKIYALNVTLCSIDALSYLVKYGEEYSRELSWLSFLVEKKYYRGARDLLADAIKDTSDLKLFYALRAEYAEWFLSKTGREFN